MHAGATDAVRHIGAQLLKISELEGTAEKRKRIVEDCKALQKHAEVNLHLRFQKRDLFIHNQITHEYVLDVGKKLTDSQKKLLEGVGRGIERVCKTPM